MKTIILALALTVLATTAQAKSKELKYDKVANAAGIANLLAKVLDSSSDAVTKEAKEALADVLNPQSSEIRTSILLVSCNVDSPSTGKYNQSCDIEIGIDDLTDDDNGWGTVNRVTVDGIISEGEFKVRAATLFHIAG